MPNDDLGQFPLPKNPTPSDDSNPSSPSTTDDAIQMPDLNDLFPSDKEETKSVPFAPPQESPNTSDEPTQTDTTSLDDFKLPPTEEPEPTPAKEPEEPTLSPEPAIDTNSTADIETKPFDSLPTFEETPDEIPSFSNPAPQTPPSFEPPIEEIPALPNDSIEENLPQDSLPTYEPQTPQINLEPEPTIDTQTTTEETLTPAQESEEPALSPEPYILTPESKPTTPDTHTPAPTPEPTPEPIPATLPSSTGPNMKLVTFVSLFIVALISVTAAAYFFQRAATLNKNLKDVTQTKEKQETLPTTTPTPSITEIDITPSASPTATITPVSTQSAFITPTPTPFESGSPLMPLSITPEILKVASKHQPNAQLLLVKSENAQDQYQTVTKYFFRNSLTEKKYFYITVTPGQEPTVQTTSVYVTPDNAIPSLNNAILQDKLGIDLAEAIQITKNLCPTSLSCDTATIKSQYMITGTNQNLWQISMTLPTSSEPVIVQVNALTKEIIFKSPVLETATPTPTSQTTY